MFGTLAKAFGLGAPEAPVFKVPAALPKLGTVTTQELMEKAGVTAPVDVPDLARKSVSELLSVLLNQQQDMLGATKTLAQALPPKTGVKWAADSARAVEAKLPPEQKEAIRAADAFHEHPTAANRDAAAKASEKAGPAGPGGLAAQAASLCDVPDGPPIPGGATLVPTCVTGAVVLAASLSPPSITKMPEFKAPAVPALGAVKIPSAPALAAPTTLPVVPPNTPAAIKNAQTFKPLLDRGIELAAG